MVWIFWVWFLICLISWLYWVLELQTILTHCLRSAGSKRTYIDCAVSAKLMVILNLPSSSTSFLALSALRPWIGPSGSDKLSSIVDCSFSHESKNSTFSKTDFVVDTSINMARRSEWASWTVPMYTLLKSAFYGALVQQFLQASCNLLVF